MLLYVQKLSQSLQNFYNYLIFFEFHENIRCVAVSRLLTWATSKTMMRIREKGGVDQIFWVCATHAISTGCPGGHACEKFSMKYENEKFRMK